LAPVRAQLFRKTFLLVLFPDVSLVWKPRSITPFCFMVDVYPWLKFDFWQLLLIGGTFEVIIVRFRERATSAVKISLQWCVYVCDWSLCVCVCVGVLCLECVVV